MNKKTGRPRFLAGKALSRQLKDNAECSRRANIDDGVLVKFFDAHIDQQRQHNFLPVEEIGKGIDGGKRAHIQQRDLR